MSFLVNLTPHEVKIYDRDGSFVHLAPSGEVARVSVENEYLGNSGGVDFFRQETGEVSGLPEPVPAESGGFGRIFVVSAMVRLAAPDRRDLASPGELLRDAEGRPKGCLGLILNR